MQIPNDQPVNAPPTDYSGRSICFYHPNNRGTGTALRLEPKVNRDDEDRYNCFFLEAARQKATAKQNAFASFDWENKITVKLGFMDICELLMVLEGRSEQAGSGRNGLYHATASGNTLISFKRDNERGGYYVSISRKRKGEEEAQRIAIGLSEAEALGLRCLLQTGLFFITFPRVTRTRRVASNTRQAA